MVDEPTDESLIKMNVKTEIQKEEHQPKLTRQLARVAVSMLILMTAYEWLKQIIFPNITIWGSHLITICFTTVLATIVSFFVIKKLHKGYQKSAGEITQRIQTEEKLQETIDHLENVFDNSAETIGIVDKNGNFIKWNKVAAEMYGYSFEEMQGKSYFNLYADKNELEKMLGQLRGDGFIREYEIDMIKKDGSIFPCSIAISILRDKNNENIGSVCVARDLSVQKQSEKERLQHEKLQGVLEITGAVCHELNQPFMAISGYAELLLMDMPDDNVFKDKIVKIKEQVDRMGKITRQLMNITKYETKEYLDGKIIDIDRAAE